MRDLTAGASVASFLSSPLYFLSERRMTASVASFLQLQEALQDVQRAITYFCLITFAVVGMPHCHAECQRVGAVAQIMILLIGHMFFLLQYLQNVLLTGTVTNVARFHAAPQ